MKLTDNIVNYSTQEQPTATELILRVGEPNLIVIAHFRTQSILSEGMLYLRRDGVIDWTDTDGSESLTALFPRFKQMIGQCSNVYLAYPSSHPVWGKYDLDPIQYLPDSVIVPVEPSNFSLGGGRN
jgi:hypothetical protein